MFPGLNKVTINGLDFKITAVEFTEEEGLLGHCSLQDAEIQIDHRSAYRMKKRTLLHEILHLIIFMAGYDENDVKEGVIVALENGIPNVLRENPQLALLIVGNESIEEDEYAQQITQNLLASNPGIIAANPIDGM